MRQKWGQHFLVQERYVHKILQVAKVTREDTILEIGPGRGILTQALLKAGANVVAIEIDPTLYQFLQQRVTHPQLTLIHGDFLGFPTSTLEELFPAPFKVVANLPYESATAILFRFLTWRDYLQSVTVMIQKDVAERICALPQDGKRHGFLSLAMTLGFQRHLAFSVPSHAFQPPPKVTSSVIHLIPQGSGWNASQEQAFLEWNRRLFVQRRKTLINNLQHGYPNWINKEKGWDQFHAFK